MTQSHTIPTMARWDEERFLRVRRSVLANWPTGAEVDIDEAAAYHRAMAATKNTAWKLRQARAEGKTLVPAARRRRRRRTAHRAPATAA